MTDAEIRSTLRRLARDHPTREGFKTTGRRTVLADDDAAPHLAEIEAWVLDNAEHEVTESWTRKPRLGQKVERVGDHTPGDVVYTISCGALDGD